MPDYREIIAKFPGTCSSCGGITNEGDVILWSKGNGAKHKECPQIEKTHELEVPEDYSTWKDSTLYSYEDVHKITRCQKCGMVVLVNEYLRGGDGTGFRSVCRACF